MKLFLIVLSLWITQTTYAHVNPIARPNATQAASLLTQTLALANQNNAKAQYHLGMLLNNGMVAQTKIQHKPSSGSKKQRVMATY
jgi:hypothetical protein